MKKKPAPRTSKKTERLPPRRKADRSSATASKLDATIKLLGHLKNDASTLLQQSAEDMVEISGLKKRLSLIEENNRGTYSRLNALEAKSHAPVDFSAMRAEIQSLQNILGSMKNSMPNSFLSDYEVRKLRKTIDAMVNA